MKIGNVGFNTSTWNAVAPVVAGGAAAKTGFKYALANWRSADGKERNVRLLNAVGGAVLSAAGVTVAYGALIKLASGK